MRIGVVKEKTVGENRVALTPRQAEKLIANGLEVVVEKNAGQKAGFYDDDFRAVKAELSDSPTAIWQNCEVIFKIQAPLPQEEALLSPHQTVIGDFSRIFPQQKLNFRAFALNQIPRISRAQSFDIRSSQSNLAGYKAALSAIDRLNRIAPLMITSAGTVPAIKLLVWGLGVAGLQAVATAKRLGARVYASDLRFETAEQVAAIFIPSEELLTNLSQFDIIITTAGTLSQAPLLIDKEILKLIAPDSLVLDIAGNVEASLSAPNLWREYNLPSQVPHTASMLFANNVYNFFNLIYDRKSQQIVADFTDEIINQTYRGEKSDVRI